MQLVKETRWVKVWRTEGGEFVDSKLAWMIEPDAGAFIADWDVVDDAGRAEMQVAFAYYPYEFVADIEKIVAHVAKEDARVASEMRASLFTADDMPDPALAAFKEKLSHHFAANPPASVLLLETPFYRVFLGETGMQIDTRVEHEFEIPSTATLLALLEPIEPRRHLARRAAKTIAENPWLLKPPPGQMAFPDI